MRDMDDLMAMLLIRESHNQKMMSDSSFLFLPVFTTHPNKKGWLWPWNAHKINLQLVIDGGDEAPHRTRYERIVCLLVCVCAFQMIAGRARAMTMKTTLTGQKVSNHPEPGTGSAEYREWYGCKSRTWIDLKCILLWLFYSFLFYS